MLRGSPAIPAFTIPEQCISERREVDEMPVVAEDSDISIVRLDVGGGIVSNAYLLVCQETGDSVIVDAPGDVSKILEQAKCTNPSRVRKNLHFAKYDASSRYEIGVGFRRFTPFPSPC